MKNKKIKILDFKKRSILELNKSNMIHIFGGTGISIIDIDGNGCLSRNSSQLQSLPTGDTYDGSSTCATLGVQTQTGPKEVFSLNCSMLCTTP